MTWLAIVSNHVIPLSLFIMYHKRESLGGTGDDRVVGIFTLANLGGGALTGLGIWLLCGTFGIGKVTFSAGWWLCAILIGGGITLGVAVTVRWSGISLLDRVILGIGYGMRRAAGATSATPPLAVPTRRAGARGPLVLLRDGKVIARPVGEEE